MPNFPKSGQNLFPQWCPLIRDYTVVQFLQKSLFRDRNLLCFVSLYLLRSCLVLMTYNKTNIPCLFVFNIEIIYPRYYNIQLRFTSLNINYLREIICDIKQKDMEYLFIIDIICIYCNF